MARTPGMSALLLLYVLLRTNILFCSSTTAPQVWRLKCLSILSENAAGRPQSRLSEVCPDDSRYLSWIFDTDEYKQWCTSPSEVLLMHSGPETELAAALSTVRNQLNTVPPNESGIRFISVAFPPNDDRFSSARSMIASLCYQLLTMDSSLFGRVQTLCEELAQTNFWRIDQLWTLRRGILSSPDLGNVVCVIHMVDNCVDFPKHFIEEAVTFMDGFETDCDVKFLVTSANAHKHQGDHAFNKELEDRVIQLDMEAHAQDGKESEQVVLDKIHQLILVRPELARFRKALIEKLAFKTPFEVSLAVRLLYARRQNVTSSEIDAEIAAISLPLSPPRLFRVYLGRIPEAQLEWAQRVASWIALARRPLSLRELAVVVALQGDGLKSLFALRDRIPQSLETDLRQTFSNLMVVQDGEVTLIDGSLRGFLLEPTEQGSTAISLYSDANLAEECLDYLTLLENEEPSFADNKKDYLSATGESECGVHYADHRGLIEYASKYWPKHYNMATGKKEPPQKLRAKVLDYLSCGGTFPWNSYNAGTPALYRDPLCRAVFLRLRDVVALLLSEGSVDKSNLNSALEITITNGDDDIFRSLSSVGACSPKSLQLAALHGREKLIKDLLVGTTPGNDNVGCRNALHEASAAGYHGIVAMLLGHGFDINAEDDQGNTPLHLASKYGHFLVLNELLRRVDELKVDVKNSSGWTPLHLACKWQSFDASWGLLRNMASAHTTGANRQTALHLASESGGEDVVSKILFRLAPTLGSENLRPSDIEALESALDSKDADDLTVFHLAARRGHAGVVRILLSSAAQLHMARVRDRGNERVDGCTEPELPATSDILTKKDKQGNTPLHLATAHGFCDVVDELTGLVPTSSGSKGRDNQELNVVFGSGVNMRDGTGNLPIHLAVTNGDIEMVQKFCAEHRRRHETLNVFGGIGQTPLHLAARDGLVDITKTLLQQGATPNVCGTKFVTPLHLACNNGNMVIMNLLLEAGAAPLDRDCQGQSALHRAVKAQNLDMVERLFQVARDLIGNNDFVNTRDNGGDTLLHLAAGHESVDVLRMLLVEGSLEPESLSIKDHRKRNLLNIALGNLEMVSFLVQEMKELSVRESDSPLSRDCDACTDLSTARTLLEAVPSKTSVGELGERGSGDRKLRQELSDLSLDFGSWDPERHGPVLRLAAAKGVIDIIDKLASVQVDSNDADFFEKEKETALLLAAENGQVESAMLLLERHSLGDGRKLEAVHLAFEEAAKYGHLEFLKRLSSSQSSVDHDARIKALEQASAAGHVKIVDFLLGETSLNDVDGSNDARKPKNLALEIALAAGQRDVGEQLLKLGAELDIPSSGSTTPLHEAVERGDLEICRLLLKADSSLLDRKDEQGRTALYIATFHDNPEIVDLLLTEYYADVEASTLTGWRPLHAAFKSLPLFERLLSAKANPDAKTNNGETPLYIAILKGCSDTALALLKAGANLVAATSTDQTPLHMLCKGAISSSDLHPFIMELPMGLADPRNAHGQSPLCLAVINGQVTLAKLLLDRQDVDVNQADNEGGSLLRNAVENKQIEVAQELLNNARLTNLNSSLPESAADDLVSELLETWPSFVGNLMRLVLEIKPGIVE